MNLVDLPLKFLLQVKSSQVFLRALGMARRRQLARNIQLENHGIQPASCGRHC
jgi:hypothetical protein